MIPYVTSLIPTPMYTMELPFSSLVTILFYLIIYNAAIFNLISCLNTPNQHPSSLPLLLTNARQTPLAFIMLITLFSLAGIPPLGGFFTKISLLALLVNEFFLLWFITFFLFLMFGIFFYLSNLRFLLSGVPLNQTTAHLTNRVPFIVTISSIMLIGTVFVCDDVLI